MSEKQVLVTGACGEIGQALVQELAKRGGYKIVTADFMPLPDSIKSLSSEHVQGDLVYNCLLYTSPSPRDRTRSRMPSSA